MIQKSKLLMLIFIIFVTISVLIGCAGDNANIVDNSSESKTSIETISEELKQDSEVYILKESKNKDYIVYAKGNEEISQVFVWKVNEKNPIELEEKIDSLENLIVSPDSKHILIVSGFDVIRSFSVLSIDEMKIIGNFNYAAVASDLFDKELPMFSPDNKWIVFAKDKYMLEIEQTDKFPATYGITLSITGFNLVDKKEKTFYEGNEKFYYYLNKIDGNNNLEIMKIDLYDKNKTETLYLDLNNLT